MANVVIERDEAMGLYATDLKGITKSVSRFSMPEGLGLVFASLSTVYTCRARGQDQSFQPTTFFLQVKEVPLFAYAQMCMLPFPGVEDGVTHFELLA